MRRLLCILLLLHAGFVRADVYAYREGADGLLLSDSPRQQRDFTLLYRAADHDRRSGKLDSQCLGRLSASARQLRRGDTRGGLRVVAETQAQRYSIDVDRAILDSAGRTALDPDLLRAMIWVESRCNNNAVSPKGARGLMQLMPDTARLYGVADPHDARANIDAGARYMRDLVAYFAGNVELALAAYNAGPRAVVNAGMRIPAYRETQAYVPAILTRMRLLKES
ncbi:MAG TPA: lytic transglycosylase domain-containing protein [Burkholderiales bacterium]|jgi:soluble lytic murein transglycosylase-like protein